MEIIVLYLLVAAFILLELFPPIIFLAYLSSDKRKCLDCFKTEKSNEKRKELEDYSKLIDRSIIVSRILIVITILRLGVVFIADGSFVALLFKSAYTVTMVFMLLSLIINNTLKVKVFGKADKVRAFATLIVAAAMLISSVEILMGADLLQKQSTREGMRSSHREHSCLLPEDDQSSLNNTF